jgi:hypothetical protein
VVWNKIEKQKKENAWSRSPPGADYCRSGQPRPVARKKKKKTPAGRRSRPAQCLPKKGKTHGLQKTCARNGVRTGEFGHQDRTSSPLHHMLDCGFTVKPKLYILTSIEMSHTSRDCRSAASPPPADLFTAIPQRRRHGGRHSGLIAAGHLTQEADLKHHRRHLHLLPLLRRSLHCCGSTPGAFPVEAPFFLTVHQHYPRLRHPFLLTLTPACRHKGTSRFMSFSWLFWMYLNLCRLVHLHFSCAMLD